MMNISPECGSQVQVPLQEGNAALHRAQRRGGEGDQRHDDWDNDDQRHDDRDNDDQHHDDNNDKLNVAKETEGRAFGVTKSRIYQSITWRTPFTQF